MECPDAMIWIKEVPVSITVCNKEGTIVEMNDRSAASYEKDGGYGLMGKNIRDCHPEHALQKSDGYASPWHFPFLYRGKRRDKKNALRGPLV